MDEDKDGVELVEHWRKELSREKRTHQKWRDLAEKVEKAYYDPEAGRGTQARLNMFWANTQIQCGALLSSPPSPEVRRRHQSAGPVEKNAALMVEEALAYVVDTEPFKGPLDLALEDALVPGMGVVRINYDPEIEQQPVGIDEVTGEPIIAPAIVNQRMSLEFFCSTHFHWQPAKRWEDVDWVAFDFKMSRREVAEQWDVDLEYEGKEEEKDKVTVTEIWDRKEKQVVVICKEHKEPLEVREDALGLQGFFPMPEPIVPYRERKTYTPIPEFYYYEKLMDQLQSLAERHDLLVKSLRDRGFADAAIGDALNSLSKAGDGTLVPVANLLAQIQQAGGGRLSDLIHHWPIENIVRVLGQVKEEIEFVKRQTYELTGISDIVRGASQASETATAQQIKGQWANVRLVRKQNALNRFVRDIFRIMSEIVCEHFQPNVLAGMTSLDEQEVMQALPLLKNDMQRSFIIDVESDSTIAKDELEERQSKLEFLQHVTGYLQNLVPQVAAGQMDAGMVKEILLLVVRSWKHGRQLEEYILGMDGTAEQLQKMQQGFQQQMQQLQQQMAQIQQQLQQVTQQRDQYAKQLQQFNAQEMQLQGIETQGEAAKDMAEARYKDAQTEQLRTQTAISQIYPAA